MRSNGNGKTAVIAYVPVLHRGYLEFFRKYDGGTVFLIGNDFTSGYQSLVRHLPANEPKDVQTMLRSLDLHREVRILCKVNLRDAKEFSNIVMPDEDVSRAFAGMYLETKRIRFDGTLRLRWDWGATHKKRRPKVEGAISYERFDRDAIYKAEKQAQRSPDWWRQVGALLVKEKTVLIAGFNRHVPSEHSAYIEGDPRSNFEPGQCIEMSLALHAEAGVIAEAAQRGISTKDCELYVTTFPCPPCAHLCAFAGIRRLYYADGYSLVAGAEVLQSKGVEIIRVSM